MPIQQKLTPPVSLFSDFAGWVFMALEGLDVCFTIATQQFPRPK